MGHRTLDSSSSKFFPFEIKLLNRDVVSVKKKWDASRVSKYKFGGTYDNPLVMSNPKHPSNILKVVPYMVDSKDGPSGAANSI